MENALNGVCVAMTDLNHLQLLVIQPVQSHDSHMTVTWQLHVWGWVYSGSHILDDLADCCQDESMSLVYANDRDRTPSLHQHVTCAAFPIWWLHMQAIKTFKWVCILIGCGGVKVQWEGSKFIERDQSSSRGVKIWSLTRNWSKNRFRKGLKFKKGLKVQEAERWGQKHTHPQPDRAVFRPRNPLADELVPLDLRDLSAVAREGALHAQAGALLGEGAEKQPTIGSRVRDHVTKLGEKAFLVKGPCRPTLYGTLTSQGCSPCPWWWCHQKVFHMWKLCALCETAYWGGVCVCVCVWILGTVLWLKDTHRSTSYRANPKYR